MSDDTPATVSAEIKAMAVDWAPATALLGGTPAMRAAGRTYLPQFPAEGSDAYSYRLSRSTLFNGFKRTVATLASKPFSEPLRLGNDVPPQLVAYAEDIDLEGRNLQAFAHEVFFSALAFGLSHILVDFPKNSALTLADERATNVRPYFVHIRADQVLGWRSQRINGAETLTQLRIMECVTEPMGNWGSQTIDQVRVLEPNSYSIYRKTEKGEWVLYESGPVSLGCIPLATVYGERQCFMVGKSPLLDLAYMNIEHWQSYSDQMNILHVARVPILFANGFNDETKIQIGANNAVTIDDPAADLKYVEHSGAAIGAGRESLKDLEERMSLFGAQMMIKVPGTRTATETLVDSEEADSALALIALNLQDALEHSLDYAASWMKLGDDQGGSVELYHDFGEWSEGISGVDQVMSACENSMISYQTAFEELQRRDVIAQDRKWEDEKKRIKEEGPRVGVIGNFEMPQNISGVTPPPVVPTSN